MPMTGFHFTCITRHMPLRAHVHVFCTICINTQFVRIRNGSDTGPPLPADWVPVTLTRGVVVTQGWLVGGEFMSNKLLRQSQCNSQQRHKGQPQRWTPFLSCVLNSKFQVLNFKMRNGGRMKASPAKQRTPTNGVLPWWQSPDKSTRPVWQFLEG